MEVRLLKIVCPKGVLRRFRKECRVKFPVEHVAAVFGKRSQDGDVLITRIDPIKHEATPDLCNIEDSEVRKSKRTALAKEEDWIGTIHSHCSLTREICCEHLSETDIRTALEYGEAICGLVFVYDRGRRTSMHWYVPQPIPEVIYV